MVLTDALSTVTYNIYIDWGRGVVSEGQIVNFRSAIAEKRLYLFRKFISCRLI